MENSFKIDGEILYIDDARPSKEGSTFMLRDFALEMAMMGEVNHIKFQLKGTNVTKMDEFLPGDQVVVSFSLLGMVKVKEDKIGCATNPKKYDGFSPNANAWKIEFAPGFQRQAKVSQPAQNQPAKNQPQDPRLKEINPQTGATWTQIEIDNDLPF